MPILLITDLIPDDSLVNYLEAGADLVVVNLMGQVVHQGTYVHPQTFSLNVNEGAGMYFATLRKGEHVFTKKLILTAN